MSNRELVIASATREFEANSVELGKFTSEAAFVNVALRDKGLRLLATVERVVIASRHHLRPGDVTEATEQLAIDTLADFAKRVRKVFDIDPSLGLGEVLEVLEEIRNPGAGKSSRSSTPGGARPRSYWDLHYGPKVHDILAR